VLAPLAGALADRWPRRRLMIGADVRRAAAVAVMLLARDPGDVWLIYLALLAESVGTVLFRPAAQAHTPAVVGTGPALTSANALNALTDGTVRLLGAPLGGALLAWAGFGPLVLLDGTTYVLSAAAILLTAPLTPARPGAGTGAGMGGGTGTGTGAGGGGDTGAGGGGGTGTGTRRGGCGRMLGDLWAGLAFLRREPVVRALLLVNTMFLGANAGLTALLVPYGITVLGGSGQVGLVMSALGVGFLVGAPLMRVLVDRVPPAYLLGGVLAATGAGYVLLFSATTLAAALPAAVLLGATGSISLGAVATTLQRVTPNGLLGRIGSALFTCEAAATLAGAIAGPAAAQALDVTRTAYLAATATVLSGLLGLVLLPRHAAARSSAGHG
jgi:predicted MFS family arabinose efflux permease